MLRQGKRRTMLKFVLNEISAVDSPAQAGATMVLMKRREDDLEKRLVLDLPEGLSAEDRGELLELAREAGRVTGVAQELILRLFAARVGQLGVAVRDVRKSADPRIDLNKFLGRLP